MTQARASLAWISLLLMLLAWSGTFASFSRNPLGLRDMHQPTVPFVAAAPGVAAEDVRSAVPRFLSALALGLLLAAAVEPARMLLVHSGSGWMTQLACLLFQASLVVDAMRLGASDWLLWTQVQFSWREYPAPDHLWRSGPWATWPWLSFLALLVAATVIAATRHRGVR